MHPQFALAFSRAIYVKVELLRTADLSVRERRRVRESIGVDVRKFTDVIDYEVSEAAWAAAQDLGVDLRTTDWAGQTRFDPKRERFHLEHVVTVRDVVEACLRADSESDIAQVLGSVRVAWILKEENHVLDGLGLRSVRPDPDEAYRLAGIAMKVFEDAE